MAKPSDSPSESAPLRSKVKYGGINYAVVMTSTLITSDGEFFKKLRLEEQKEFFKQSYEYLKDRYGEKNIVSATIHMDETNPHMHLCSVPLTEKGRLSAKILFDRKGLLTLQKELPSYLKSKSFDIQKGESSEKHPYKIIYQLLSRLERVNALMNS